MRELLLLLKAAKDNNVYLPPEILKYISDVRQDELGRINLTLNNHLLSDWRQHDQRLDPFAWDDRLTARGLEPYSIESPIPVLPIRPYRDGIARPDYGVFEAQQRMELGEPRPPRTLLALPTLSTTAPTLLPKSSSRETPTSDDK